MASFQRFPTPYPTQDPATGHDMIDLTMSDAESETICGDGSSDCDIISISGDESDGTMAMDGDRDEVIAIMDSESDGIVSISDDEDGNNENVSGDELELEQDVSDSLIQEVELLGVPDDEEQLDEATGPDGLIVFPGDTVEFLDESFLRVVCITVKEGHVSLWGIRLLRNRQVDARWSDREGHWLCSLLRHLPNDLCAIVRIKRALPNPSLQDSIVNRPIQLVIRKRKVFFTNSMWPGFSCYSRDDPKATAMPKELKEDHGWLVCRWKYIEEVDAIRKRVSAFQMRRLEEIECDPGYGHSSKNLMTAYSEKIGLGMGAYTYGDIGAGGGGSARAAKIGGLIHKFLLDNDENACATLGLNFGKGVVAKMDLRDFSQVKGGKYKVHVLHISFPCQGHSAANRHQNPELDALRIVLGCCLSDILKVCKPRIVTIEQVQGIEKRSADGQYLRKYIQDLTEQGYQCRWKVINFGQYGNPQDRKRVVIMAACPGQSLPTWPKATHGDREDLKPFVTIADTLARVPKRLPDHMKQYTPRPGSIPPNADEPLRQCITGTGGEGDIHPWEDRSFNMAELALLAGFPPRHRFPALSKTVLRKMIGNAVPAEAFVPFVAESVKALKETDLQLLSDLDQERKVPGGCKDNAMRID